MKQSSACKVHSELKYGYILQNDPENTKIQMNYQGRRNEKNSGGAESLSQNIGQVGQLIRRLCN